MDLESDGGSSSQSDFSSLFVTDTARAEWSIELRQAVDEICYPVSAGGVYAAEKLLNLFAIEMHPRPLVRMVIEDLELPSKLLKHLTELDNTDDTFFIPYVCHLIDGIALVDGGSYVDDIVPCIQYLVQVLQQGPAEAREKCCSALGHINKITSKDDPLGDPVIKSGAVRAVIDVVFSGPAAAVKAACETLAEFTFSDDEVVKQVFNEGPGKISHATIWLIGY